MFLLKKIWFKEHQIQKFTSNADLRKQDFLSEEKLSDCSRFWKKVNNEDIFTLRDVFVYKQLAAAKKILNDTIVLRSYSFNKV